MGRTMTGHRMRERLLTPTGAMQAWVTLLIVLLSFGAGLGLTIGYVVKRSREFCGVVVLIDDRNQKLTATSDDQQRFIDELHRYRRQLGCKDGDQHG